MALHLTGHYEIDHQHSMLQELADRLNQFCSSSESKPSAACSPCPPPDRLSCADSLARLTGELLAFLVGHANYEESLMVLLPSTPFCKRHIERHTRAHRDILRRLNRIAAAGDHVNPRTRSAKLHQALHDWMGSHTTEFDSSLTDSLLEVGHAEIAYDGQLVHILDEFVFHNRPTRLQFPRLPGPAESDAQVLVRARLNSLTPRQKEVCQLMVLGRTNKAIAERLGLTVNTIKTHRAQVFQKMEVASLLDLAREIDLARSGKHDKATPETAHVRKARGAPASQAGGLRVLVVEPSRTLRETLVAGINALGHRAAGTAIEDLREWGTRSKCPDLAIVSIGASDNIAEVSGLLSRLKQTCSCGLYVASPLDGHDEKSRRRKIKADAYLPWPLDFGELSAEIRRLASRPA